MYMEISFRKRPFLKNKLDMNALMNYQKIYFCVTCYIRKTKKDLVVITVIQFCLFNQSGFVETT